MVNICEPLINVVKENKPKVLGCFEQPNPLTGIHRLGPKGKGPRMGARPMYPSALTHRRRSAPGGEAYLRYVGPNLRRYLYRTW
jgi:hypothetical protein